jgi:midasin (ATPase involved in ribosome maturation)
MSSPKFFSIRELQRQDMALMNAMMVMFADSFGDADTYTSARQKLSGAPARLEAFIALVALAGKTVVGGLTAYDCRNMSRSAARYTSTIWLWRQIAGARELQRH